MSWLKKMLRTSYEEGPITKCRCGNVDEVIVHDQSKVAEHTKCGGLLGAEDLPKGKWKLEGSRRGKGLWRRR